MRNSTQKARIEKGVKKTPAATQRPKTLKAKAKTNVQRSAADGLLAQAERGIPNWAKHIDGMGNKSPSDMVRGVNDFGLNDYA